LKKNKIQAIFLLGILLINVPLFFDIYRQCAFKIVPYDDYVPYLLHLLGKGGSIPGSPSGYRLLSVLIAIPFYHVLPLFKFSLLEVTNDDYLMALEALSFVSYLAASFSAFLIYKITKNKFKSEETTAILAGLIALFLFRFTAIYSVDLTAICMICLLFYYLDSKWIFACLLILSVGFNEKIAFLFFMLFGGRFVLSNHRNAAYFIISTIAFLAYFSIRKLINLPGHEYMLQPSMFLENVNNSMVLLFTLKGFILNWISGTITIILFFLALKEYQHTSNIKKILFSPVDFLPILGFIIITLVTDMQFTIGRILLFCFPLYLPLATLYIVRSLNKTKKIDQMCS